ncbi:phycobilisome rod-core linker polypeptide [Candidatus Cyanaurora vandensis]|uniref:phycobilisome rod-core linker polypeptide n=1 Tax=Candidatus Cyanaurora vandensis TaxID=2714958 RepID=UPI00257D9C2A|nr:phycobilisome rod-core linker polypeptide [Candidatus Cyanaurora vandensis]
MADRERYTVEVQGLVRPKVRQSCTTYNVDYEGLQALLKKVKSNGGRVTSINKLETERNPRVAPLVTSSPVELWPDATEDELQGVLRAVYRQVLGNAYIMDAERLNYAESQLRNGDFTVSDFVRTIAKSDLYKSRFFTPVSQTRFVELNFQHLLGRAPFDQAEISMHIQLYAAAGYDAEIDSYLDGAEYQEYFGANVAPYNRNFLTQRGQVNANFTRGLKLYPGFAGSDIPSASTRSALLPAL